MLSDIATLDDWMWMGYLAISRSFPSHLGVATGNQMLREKVAKCMATSPDLKQEIQRLTPTNSCLSRRLLMHGASLAHSTKVGS